MAAAAESRVNLGNKAEVILIEAYAKAKLGIFELKAGRSKDIMGLVDTTLSTGAFSMSGNALGIPKVQVSIPEYWPIPILGGVIAIQGQFAYGWFGRTPIAPNPGGGGIPNTPPVVSYFQQKSLYARFGKPNWRLKVYGGINHQSIYGSEQKIFRNFNLTKFESFLYAFTGKTWSSNSGFLTKLGNHIGSVDLGFTYDLDAVKVFVYRQQFYDVGALGHLANIRDGLNGISIQNKKSGNTGWSKILFEFLYTKNQAGELWSPFTPSGDESYYNNSMYTSGWSYNAHGIGNPFLTPRHEARSNLRYKVHEYFVNNRVVAFHTGIEGKVNKTRVITKLSYSRNFGTYGTSSIGSTLGGKRNVLPPPYFEQVNQFSGYLELNRSLANNWQIGLATAFDSGKLLYNSYGLLVSAKKTFSFPRN